MMFKIKDDRMYKEKREDFLSFFVNFFEHKLRIN